MSEEAARAALSAGEVSLVMRDFLVGGADPRAAASVLLAMVAEFFGGSGDYLSYSCVSFGMVSVKIYLWHLFHLDIRFIELLG